MAAPNEWSLGGLRFDAWLRLNQNSSLTITEHPVETGAAISDHSFRNPRRWSFDIGITDVIPGSVAGGSQSKAVNAYNTLVNLQLSRQLLTLRGKYGTYGNVLISDIDISDDYTTKTTARPTVVLQEVILASQSPLVISSNPQATNQTDKGAVTPAQPRGFIQEAFTFFTGIR